ncbi:hypothetical protein E0H51_16895 [Rhizobium leguminosarum bv. viciae]|uniref:hypothetical protein n=1 Tax=Rhizobium leguminosarum TaxID=384 RepID=UPI001040CDEB|nr:hypothetical protein [Rhizobium leguminosarum]TBY75807.1 hypothetical protein E0H51_16895 [Rhizobium leguminosarum bv. viciae]
MKYPVFNNVQEYPSQYAINPLQVAFLNGTEEGGTEISLALPLNSGLWIIAVREPPQQVIKALEDATSGPAQPAR